MTYATLECVLAIGLSIRMITHPLMEGQCAVIRSLGDSLKTCNNEIELTHTCITIVLRIFLLLLPTIIVMACTN